MDAIIDKNYAHNFLNVIKIIMISNTSIAIRQQEIINTLKVKWIIVAVQISGIAPGFRCLNENAHRQQPL